MNPLFEQLNEQIERQFRSSSREQFQPSSQMLERDPIIDDLVDVAHRLHDDPAIQVRPDFARHLGRQILLRNAEMYQKQVRQSGSWLRLFSARPALGIALLLLVLLLLSGTGVLVAAAQITNPDNPLYALKRWEQQVQVSISSSPEKKVEMDIQSAKDRLNTLSNLTTPSQAASYQQALADLDKQISTVQQEISQLPVGASQTNLLSELATLKAEARHTLHALLPQLALPEQIVTTLELGRLGDAIPDIKSVEITLPAHANEQTTILISGVDIQVGSRLFIDGQLLEARGFLQNGAVVFLLTWNKEKHPQSIGILNPDNTAAQTTAIVVKDASGTSGGNGNSGDNGKGNGHGNGKPTTTPTPVPHH